ncbi:hypothetical protein TNCV_4926481 [Trichonephila clavipes]|nr:hypothetical protein TNCV_4926481 [Trichonephila clavipes]
MAAELRVVDSVLGKSHPLAGDMRPVSMHGILILNTPSDDDRGENPMEPEERRVKRQYLGFWKVCVFHHLSERQIEPVLIRRKLPTPPI